MGIMWSVDNPLPFLKGEPLEVLKSCIEAANKEYESSKDENCAFRAALTAYTAAKNEIIIKKTDEELQIVWGEVYVPNFPDSQGDFMGKEEIRYAAYNFLKEGRQAMVDVNHDNNSNYGCYVVESFIARKNDPIFIEDSWVVGIHIDNDELWNKVKNQEINGFSMQVRAIQQKMTFDMDIPDYIIGTTEVFEDHSHKYLVKFDNEGNFIGGYSDIVDGHYHLIIGGTVTEKSKDHAHRFAFIDKLVYAD